MAQVDICQHEKDMLSDTWAKQMLHPVRGHVRTGEVVPGSFDIRALDEHAIPPAMFLYQVIVGVSLFLARMRMSLLLAIRGGVRGLCQGRGFQDNRGQALEQHEKRKSNDTIHIVSSSRGSKLCIYPMAKDNRH